MTVKLAQKSVALGDCGEDSERPQRRSRTIPQNGHGDGEDSECLEVRLVDGIIYAFQEQTTEDQVVLDAFGTVVNALGIRVKPYLTQIVSTILWWLNSGKCAEVRQQAADLTTYLAVVIKHGLVLFEQLVDLREYHSIIDFFIDYFCSSPHDTNSP